MCVRGGGWGKGGKEGGYLGRKERKKKRWVVFNEGIFKQSSDLSTINANTSCLLPFDVIEHVHSLIQILLNTFYGELLGFTCIARKRTDRAMPKELLGRWGNRKLNSYPSG